MPIVVTRKNGARPGAKTTAPTPHVRSASSSRGGKPKGGGREPVMKTVDVLLFTGELADLIEAGMTLGQALGALSNQGEEGSPQRLIAADLTARIVNGESFSDALARHPRSFPPLYSNMVRAGEASGAMVEVLRRLAEHYERQDNMRAKIISALSYPCVVLVFGVVAVICALVWIIPKFQKVFESMGGELPLPTRMLIGLSDVVINYGVFIGIVLFGVWLAAKKWVATDKGRMTIDGWKLKVPLIKGIIACGIYSSLAYTLKTLLTNGVNVLHALRISEETCGNAVIAAALANARKRVTDGTSISGPLAASGVFPKMMIDMLAVGEQAGDMASSLEHIGVRYQKDMDRAIQRFTNMLEPILIISIAAVIGFVAIAVLMAVFNMSNALGNG